MTALMTLLLGRMPIGWLQLSHSRSRLMAAIAGVAFANILVFTQLGIMGALNSSVIAPYTLFRADIMLSSSDANTLTDGSNIARSRGFEAMTVPGVADVMPLHIANLEWQREDATSSTLQIFGINPAKLDFLGTGWLEKSHDLLLEDAVLLDVNTRGLTAEFIKQITSGDLTRFEAGNRTLSIMGTLQLGGGFSADGTLITSDQTFLRLFQARSSGAPSHILVKVVEGLDTDVVISRLQAALPDTVTVQTYTDAAKADQRYQTTERPTGVIFGFGVIIGVLVGIVIVYQILSTDVADHLREYATFKAMGYRQSFFLGIVFEQATLLAILGFMPGLIISIFIYSGLSLATGLPVVMGVPRASLVFLGTLLACALSGALATRRLAQADPADLF